jgi:dipeptidyl aminopeptidase/acylaminoacyl peptidase
VYLPRPHQGFGVPPGLINLLIAGAAIGGTLVAWAAFAHGTIRTNDDYLVREAPIAPLAIDPLAIRSVAYAVPGAFSDEIRLAPLDGARAPVTIARVPHTIGSRVQGIVSPAGERLAVLSIPQDHTLGEDASPTAELSLIALPRGDRSVVAGRFDPLSRLEWSPDGSRIAAVRSTIVGEAGLRSASVVEVNVTTGAERHAARFDNVLEVAPVGYSIDGARLFIVVVDNGGSTLWAERDGMLRRVGSLSAGRTRDWRLSPDGSRLAYIDILSTTDRSYAGRTFVIAAGAIAGGAMPGVQLGAAYRPGAEVADFGSPAGEAWHLEPLPEQPVFVVPLAWSPDGTTLAASIFAIEAGRIVPSSGVFELVSPSQRLTLEEGARFLGFARSE